MDGDNMVSAVVTTYKRPVVAKRAILSAVDQSFSNTETIVVEDGSDSGVEEWLEEQGLDDVTYIRHDENRGLTVARNTGLEAAQGNYVAYLDDDDKWKLHRIQKQIDILSTLSPSERENLGVIYCGVEVRDSDGNLVSTLSPKNIGLLRDEIVSKGASTLPSTCLFPREVLEHVGGYDETLQSSVDHDIWMKLAVHGYEARAVEEPLVVTYQSDSDTMVTDVHPRIQGVRDFVEKWQPTYREWFGESAGQRYADRYFARVIGVVLREKITNKEWSAAYKSLRAILEYSDEHIFNMYVIGFNSTAPLVDFLLPGPFVKRLKRVTPDLKRNLNPE